MDCNHEDTKGTATVHPGENERVFQIYAAKASILYPKNKKPLKFLPPADSFNMNHAIKAVVVVRVSQEIRPGLLVKAQTCEASLEGVNVCVENTGLQIVTLSTRTSLYVSLTFEAGQQPNPPPRQQKLQFHAVNASIFYAKGRKPARFLPGMEIYEL